MFYRVSCRELAKQTFGVLQKFLAPTSLSGILLIGGTDVAADIDACTTKGCNIVVATPGRLLDMMNRLQTAEASGVTFKVGAVLL